MQWGRINNRGNPRVGLSGTIGADDGGEVGVAKQEGVVALVGLEV